MLLHVLVFTQKTRSKSDSGSQLIHLHVEATTTTATTTTTRKRTPPKVTTPWVKKWKSSCVLRDMQAYPLPGTSTVEVQDAWVEGIACVI